MATSKSNLRLLLCLICVVVEGFELWVISLLFLLSGILFRMMFAVLHHRHCSVYKDGALYFILRTMCILLNFI